MLVTRSASLVASSTGGFEDDSSRKTLAHELAHVVQQRLAHSPPEPTVQRASGDQADVELDEFYEYLAANPGEALKRWPRLTGIERTNVFLAMTRMDGVEFAKAFLLEAANPTARTQAPEVTNVRPTATPEELLQQGYRLRSENPRAQYFVHPSGKELWLQPRPEGPPPAPSGSRAVVPAKAPPPPTPPIVAPPQRREPPEVAKLRQRLDSLATQQSDINAGLAQLRAMGSTPEADKLSTRLAGKVSSWEREFITVRGELNDNLAKTVEDVESMDPSRMIALQQLGQRAELLDQWWRISLPVLTKGLPGTVGDWPQQAPEH